MIGLVAWAIREHFLKLVCGFRMGCNSYSMCPCCFLHILWSSWGRSFSLVLAMTLDSTYMLSYVRWRSLARHQQSQIPTVCLVPLILRASLVCRRTSMSGSTCAATCTGDDLGASRQHTPMAVPLFRAPTNNTPTFSLYMTLMQDIDDLRVLEARHGTSQTSIGVAGTMSSQKKRSWLRT